MADTVNNANTTSDIEQRGNAIDRSDPRWYYAIALAGITLAMAAANATREPGLIEVTVAIGMAAVFLMLVRAVMPEGNHA